MRPGSSRARSGPLTPTRWRVVPSSPLIVTLHVQSSPIGAQTTSSSVTVGPSVVWQRGHQ